MSFNAFDLFVAASQDKESKEETTPAESDDNSSDYFADDETSCCESFEHDDEFTSNPEGKDAAEKDSPTGKSKERLLKDPPYSSIPTVPFPFFHSYLEYFSHRGTIWILSYTISCFSKKL
ncbi:PREDICTED: uncharacterized protein LOC107355766 isoform X1 [Acropora digitifera]|uniref:uncharacterized protein LOC107355766 isoform X1 n=1 Tax=Acropora digitifera TaxID=70779 RepID=UPI00077B1165|nr:PREDICTED: uncharacterized protein LOC107355766 isoform X1 [Acropora digitifera]